LPGGPDRSVDREVAQEEVDADDDVEGDGTLGVSGGHGNDRLHTYLRADDVARELRQLYVAVTRLEHVPLTVEDGVASAITAEGTMVRTGSGSMDERWVPVTVHASVVTTTWSPPHVVTPSMVVTGPTTLTPRKGTGIPIEQPTPLRIRNALTRPSLTQTMPPGLRVEVFNRLAQVVAPRAVEKRRGAVLRFRSARVLSLTRKIAFGGRSVHTLKRSFFDAHRLASHPEQRPPGTRVCA
jgi:hypothetical protein